MKITDTLLDQVYKLTQRRTREIEETGATFTIGNKQIKAIQEGNVLYLAPGAPVRPGMLVTHVDLFGCYIVTEVLEEAGRLVACLEHLPALASVYQVASSSVDILDRPHYKLIATNWTSIPCTAPIDGKIKFPVAYSPDAGEVIQAAKQQLQVKDTQPKGVLVEITVEPW